MDLPDDLSEELSATGLLKVFTALSPSHQAEYLQWINGAKKPETRQSRIVKTCEMLAAKSSL